MRPAWRTIAVRLRTLVMAAAASGAAHVPHPAHAAVSSAEQAAWDKARGSGNATAFQRYLELYPTGQYAEEAFRTLVEKTWRNPRRVEPAAGPGQPADLSRGLITAAAGSIY